MTNTSSLTGWLSDNPEWKTDETGRLERQYDFNNFVNAFSFLYKISVEAEKMDHHPDFSLFSYNKVRITLYTHSRGAVTEADMKLAGIIEKIYRS